MAGCLYQRAVGILFMLVVATTGGGGQDTGSSSVAQILAVFDQSEMETMERVTHKTLIALNKEKTARTGSSGNGGGRWNRLLNSGFGVNVTSSINNKKSRSKWLAANAGAAARLTVDSVTFSSQCVSQSDGRRSRPSHKLTHRPEAVLVLMSADDRFVFRMALAAAPFQLPVIGARLPNEDSTIHLSGLVFFFELIVDDDILRTLIAYGKRVVGNGLSEVGMQLHPQ